MSDRELKNVEMARRAITSLHLLRNRLCGDCRKIHTTFSDLWTEGVRTDDWTALDAWLVSQPANFDPQL